MGGIKVLITCIIGGFVQIDIACVFDNDGLNTNVIELRVSTFSLRKTSPSLGVLGAS